MYLKHVVQLNKKADTCVSNFVQVYETHLWMDTLADIGIRIIFDVYLYKRLFQKAFPRPVGMDKILAWGSQRNEHRKRER